MDLIVNVGLTRDSATARAMPEDVLRNTGIEFDVRAAVRVAGKESLKFPSVPPVSVTGIPVNRRCRRLHFLHGTSWDTSGQTIEISAYVLRFSNGNCREFPIVYGEHVRADWWWNDGQPAKHAVLAWTREKETKEHKGPVRLYKTTWENPDPEIMITELDFVSTMTKSSPYLIALTAEEPAPGTPESLLLKGKALEDQGDFASALQRFTEAVGLARTDSGLYKRTLERALISRSSVLKQMNRINEAIADNLAAHGIPPRKPDARPQQIDLSLFYNYELTGILGMDPDSPAAEAMEEDVRRNAGVSFDLRGLVALGGQPGDSHFPLLERQPTLLSFQGVPVNRRFTRLHVLHGTSKDVPDGTPIGKYVLHYADGSAAELPFVYGRDIRNWWGWLDGQETPGAVLAWTGLKRVPGFTSTQYSSTVRLYKITKANPRPEVEVKSLDFVSTRTKCAPFLIAVTVE